MRNCSEIFIKKNIIKGNVLSSIAKNGLTRIYTHECNLKEIKAGDKILLSTRISEDREKIPSSLLEIVQISNVADAKTEITIKDEIDIPDDLNVIWAMTKGDGNSTIKKPLYYIPGLLYNRGERVELFESNIDPMLRFLHIKNIQPCGWISIPTNSEKSPEITQGDLEYTVDWREVSSLDCNQKGENQPIKTLAFDIECGSSHGDFPNAIKGYTKLAKELLELKIEKITPDYIRTILTHITNNNYEGIHQVFLKKKQRFKTDQIDYLAFHITRYLWLNYQANNYRLSGHIEFTKDELTKSLYLEELSETEFNSEILKICDIIPSLNIYPKKTFCGWKDENDNQYTLSYGEDRDPSCYTEISLTALLDSRLPPLEGDRSTRMV